MIFMIILKIFTITWLITALLMGLAFMWYRSTKNPNVMDMFWPIGILVSMWAHTYFGGVNGLAVLFLTLLFVWAIRWIIYLYVSRIRLQANYREFRLYALAKRFTKTEERTALLQFQFQAVLQAFIVTSIAGICYATLSSSFYYVGTFILGIFVTIGGIFMETLADSQLYRFKKQHDFQRTVFSAGLWRFTRHPNLFFEWLVWVGFAMMNTAGLWGGWALLSPILVYAFIRFVMIPMFEEFMHSSMGELYAEYRSRTSLFFPKLPRR